MRTRGGWVASVEEVLDCKEADLGLMWHSMHAQCTHYTRAQPQVEAMEASWNRIRTISGAETSEDVIAYWEGLKAKEEQMRELVKLAEQREAAAKS